MHLIYLDVADVVGCLNGIGDIEDLGRGKIKKNIKIMMDKYIVLRSHVIILAIYLLNLMYICSFYFLLLFYSDKKN